MKNEIKIKNDLCCWVASQSTVFNGEAVSSDLAIISKRIITSVQLMDLILYLEHLRGTPINPRHIKPGAFNTVDSIYQHFFSPDIAHA